MQVTIPQLALSRELALLAPAADRKASIPILGNVRIVADGEGVTLTATDLEHALVSRVPCAVGEPGAICLPAKRLQALVGALSGDIAIRTDDKQYATVTAGRSRSRIAGMSVESYPELPAAPEASASLDARAFARQLARVAFAISFEESRFTLNGALVELEGSVVRCVATDGHRLAWTEYDGVTSGTDGKYLMPKAAMSHYIKLADRAEGGARVEIAQDDAHLWFRLGQRTLMARKVVGNFPDYKRVLPKYDAHVSADRVALIGAIERVAQFADERSRAVRVKLAAGELGLLAQSIETGESEESLPVEGAIDLELGLNAQYVLDALKSITHERVAIFARDAKSAAEIRPMAGAGSEKDPYYVGTDQRCVVMPMRT